MEDFYMADADADTDADESADCLVVSSRSILLEMMNAGHAIGIN